MEMDNSSLHGGHSPLSIVSRDSHSQGPRRQAPQQISQPPPNCPKPSLRKPSPQGKGQGGVGRTPLLSLSTDTHLVTYQCSFPFDFYQNPHLKKKNKKPHHPTQDTPPPTSMGTTGNSTVGSGKNREQKKRLVWSSASWSGSRGLRCCHPPLAGLHSPAVPQCFSGASSSPTAPMGTRRYVQEGVGDWGLRCQRPPPLEVGKGRFLVLFVALLLDRP